MKNIRKTSQNKKDEKESLLSNTQNPSLSDQAYNPYLESAQSLSLIKKDDTSDLDKTRKILFELSDLMTNFSFKVQHHQEMTQQSKFINYNF